MPDTLDCGHKARQSAHVDDVEICLACATLLTRLALKRAHFRGESFPLYLAEGTETNVPETAVMWFRGNPALGQVVWRGKHHVNKYQDRVYPVHVQDVHGNLWYGRGSVGCSITLRPMKAKASK